MRFWGGLGCQNTKNRVRIWTPFGDQFQPKIEKGRPKRHPKINIDASNSHIHRIHQKTGKTYSKSHYLSRIQNHSMP